MQNLLNIFVSKDLSAFIVLPIRFFSVKDLTVFSVSNGFFLSSVYLPHLFRIPAARFMDDQRREDLQAVSAFFYRFQQHE